MDFRFRGTREWRGSFFPGYTITVLNILHSDTILVSCPSKSSWLCQLGPLNCRNASKGRALIPLNGLAMIGGPELSVPPLNPVVLSLSLDCNLLFRAWRPHVIDTWGRLLCVRSTSLRDTFGDSVVRQRDEKLGTYANRNMTILYIHAE